MKFVVDKLPNTCEECDFCAVAVVQTPLGVAKQVNLCTLQTLAPPKTPNQEPNFIDVKKAPIENYCPCTDNQKKIIESNDVNSTPVKSSIIL